MSILRQTKNTISVIDGYIQYTDSYQFQSNSFVWPVAKLVDRNYKTLKLLKKEILEDDVTLDFIFEIQKLISK